MSATTPARLARSTTAALALMAVAASGLAAEDAAGLLQVEMPPAAQQRAGITTTILEAVTRQPETVAVAKVMDLQALIRQAGEAAAAAARLRAARTRAEADAAVYRRLQGLADSGAGIPLRDVEQARADWQAAQGAVASLEAQVEALRLGLRHRWGPVLAQAARDGGVGWYEELLAREQVLVRVTLPPGIHLDPAVSQLHLSASASRAEAQPATVVSEAPISAGRSPGTSWFLRSDAGGLRVGMRLQAWVPRVAEPVRGVVLPASAIVWQGGRPWAYVQLDPAHFVRRPLPPHEGHTDGESFVRKNFAAGDKVVTVGAQLLLGEELAARIPEEDDD